MSQQDLHYLSGKLFILYREYDKKDFGSDQYKTSAHNAVVRNAANKKGGKTPPVWKSCF